VLGRIEPFKQAALRHLATSDFSSCTVTLSMSSERSVVSEAPERFDRPTNLGFHPAIAPGTLDARVFVRLAIVSDIHGNLPALEAVVADFERRGVDRVVNLGDGLSGPLLPRETAQYLMATDWIHLAGNHERQLLEFAHAPSDADAYAHGLLDDATFAWMATLTSKLALDEHVLLCHGTPRSDVEYFLDTPAGFHTRPASPAEIEDRLDGVTAPVVVCGHTHSPRIMRSPRGQLLVNPGSVGQPAYLATRPHPHVMESGSPNARYAIVERSGADWKAELVAVPYDHRSMAALARSRGRVDWERALSSGYASPS
jgi:putative phosphoesterase